MELRRGDILLVDFDPGSPGEAAKVRPAILVTNDVANAYSPVVVVVPLTSNISRIYPFELYLPADRTGLDRDSKAQVQLIRHVHRRRVRAHLGTLPGDLLEALDIRIREHLGLE
ncbi:type II toxin-antitoxin system PemK/MazF family toxin [Thermus sp. PS18]|uniref:type II toxin-antitoxin system PemK/MazF family toxin n=1 Tax=Thermus sp. PS18 TaxID=2849039 RepID=UPI0022641DB7|nr:type II toxin-antitoxin system PemK/MazF family toxin [Thermus sp. PS18]UZX14589.1 type II toxin-antitoxin system PemK/MazF family toxin [Thermus sp. PS18]